MGLTILFHSFIWMKWWLSTKMSQQTVSTITVHSIVCLVPSLIHRETILGSLNVC